MLDFDILSSNRRQYLQRLNNYAEMLWEEVNVWDEIKFAFKDKDHWRYVVKSGEGQFAEYHGPRNSLDDMLSWKDNIFEATLFKTYSEANAVKAFYKTINIIIIRPI